MLDCCAGRGSPGVVGRAIVSLDLSSCLCDLGSIRILTAFPLCRN